MVDDVEGILGTICAVKTADGTVLSLPENTDSYQRLKVINMPDGVVLDVSSMIKDSPGNQISSAIVYVLRLGELRDTSSATNPAMKNCVPMIMAVRAM